MARTEGLIERPNLIAIEQGRNKLSGGQSRDAVAKGLGVTVDTLLQYLDGAFGEPSLEAARRMLKASEAPTASLDAIFRQALGELTLTDRRNIDAYAAIVEAGVKTKQPGGWTVEKAVAHLKEAVRGGEVAPDEIEPPVGKRRSKK